MNIQECRDINAQESTGVQIGTLGHKLWICVDGQCVLRIKSPKIGLTDLRIDQNLVEAAPALLKACQSAIELLHNPDNFPDCQPTYGMLRGAVSQALKEE